MSFSSICSLVHYVFSSLSPSHRVVTDMCFISSREFELSYSTHVSENTLAFEVWRKCRQNKFRKRKKKNEKDDDVRKMIKKRKKPRLKRNLRRWIIKIILRCQMFSHIWIKSTISKWQITVTRWRLQKWFMKGSVQLGSLKFYIGSYMSCFTLFFLQNFWNILLRYYGYMRVSVSTFHDCFYSGCVISDHN